MMKSIKTVLSYLTIIFILLIYTFFLDGKTGMIMIAFFTVVPIISLTLTIIASRSISAELICDENFLKKDMTLNYKIKINKSNFIPAPFVSLVISSSPHFLSTDAEIIRISVPFKKEISVNGTITPYISGNAYISIDSAYISDYLNIFSFKLKNVSYVKSMDIVPEIHEINSIGNIFKAVSDSVLIDENEEETVVSDFNISSSFPGYEYREYTAGDSLKRINWKLSSKKGTLMVRLDENMPSMRPLVVLNLSECLSYTQESILMREQLTEGCLCFINFCLMHGVECRFCYYEDGEWKCENISTYDELAEIALRVSSFPETCGETYIPEFVINSDSCILFIQKYCDKLESDKEIMIVTVERESGKNLWYIDEDFQIKELRGN